MGVQLPAEMAQGAVILNSQTMGVQHIGDGGVNHAALQVTHAHAAVGFDPVGIAAHAGALPLMDITGGLALLSLCGGSAHPPAAAAGQQLADNGVHSLPSVTQSAGPQAGLGQQKKPDGHSR